MHITHINIDIGINEYLCPISNNKSLCKIVIVDIEFFVSDVS